MKIDRLVLGEFETNCYIARSSDEATGCLVIDTGLDPGARELLAFLDRHKLTPAAAAFTHGHIDHIAGIDALWAKFPSLTTYIHKLDAELLTDSVRNLSFMMDSTGSPQADGAFSARPADCLVDEGDIISQAGIKLRVIHTPGHTPGGICLYAEPLDYARGRQDGIIFVGDTLFADGVGRTDFPGGNMRQLIEGIKAKLFILPDNTVVYPGHGPTTTIGREKANNPFLH